MRLTQKFRVVAILFASMTMSGSMLYAKELPSGTVISKSNLDQIKSDTFEGHTIASLLPEKIEWQIRTMNRKMKLRASRPVIYDPAFIAASKKYSGQVKLDVTTKEVTGFQAGVPFPDVSEKDPDAGFKLLWNFYHGGPSGSEFGGVTYWVLVDGNKGVDQIQEYVMERLWCKNRMSGPPVVLDGSCLTKTLYTAISPEDVKGTGTFTVRYDEPRFEDQWAYIKSARRIRRLSGNAWMDPVGGLGMLNDDLFIWNSRPSWYPKIKLLGKRWILVATDVALPKHDVSKKGTPGEWPMIDLTEAPYWNPSLEVEYQPREVWVIEATPPKEHPYGKKIVYMDTQIPTVYVSEIYDKKGEYWQHVQYDFKNIKGSDGIWYYVNLQGEHVDFKAKRAAIFVAHGETIHVNIRNKNLNDYSPEMIERAAR